MATQDYAVKNAYQLGQNGQATGRYFLNDPSGVSHEVTGADASHFQGLGVDASKIQTIDQFNAPRTSGGNFTADQLSSKLGEYDTSQSANAAANALARQPATNGNGTPGFNPAPQGSSAVSTQTNSLQPATPGQQPGGLQMPTGAAAGTVFDPISGKQVTPAEKAFNELQAKGKPPQESGAASSAVNTAIAAATPPNPAATTSPAVENFFQNSPTLQQSTNDLMNFLSPPGVQQQLTDQLAKITSDQNTLASLNTQMMNINRVMSGTTDDLRKEIQSVGGMASESQVLALSTARNKTLLQQANLIQDSISTAQNAIANDTTLYQNEKDLANTQFSQRSAVYQIAQKNQQDMVQAAKDGANTVIQAIGYAGYLSSLQAQGPSAVAAGEKALGIAPGQLQSLVQTQQAQQNANAIANAGITTPFVNKNGEIQSQTGYAYTSEQDFFNKTGMTIQQAQTKGMVSEMKPSLDVQAKKADIALKQGQVDMLPLDAAQKKAAINASNASAASSVANATKTRLETSQLLDGSSTDKAQQKLEQEYRQILVKEVSSRSGTLGTEDAKVTQANHLATLLNQYYDPKTGQYNVPKAQYGELVLGLAGMLSKTGTPTDSQTDNINTRTAKGDFNGAVTYITGVPTNGSTNEVIKNLADSISRQAKTAEQNREAGLNVLRGLKPTDLEAKRAAALEQNTLTPYMGIKGIDNTNQPNPTSPQVPGTTGVSNGMGYKIIN